MAHCTPHAWTTCAVAVVLALAALACDDGEPVPNQTRSMSTRDQVSTASFLSRYSFDDSATVVTVPHDLKEISGLALSPDGRLFAEEDEDGTVYQLDPNDGTIIKRFSIGDKKDKPMHGDFEDLEIVGDRFYLMESGGDIYAFNEGSDGAVVPYDRIKTGLSDKNNIEGLCYDPSTNALLMALKDDPGKGLHDVRAIWSWSLEDGTTSAKPRFTLSRDSLHRCLDASSFHPSAIARTPDGSFLVLSAHVPSIVEISSDGTIIDCRQLSDGLHPQPEGVAVMPDGTLLISSEGHGVEPRLVRIAPTKR